VRRPLKHINARLKLTICCFLRIDIFYIFRLLQ